MANVRRHQPTYRLVSNLTNSRMSKSDRSYLWFARFDGDKETLRTKCRELSACLDVFEILAAYHEGDKKENPHCHFVVELKGDKAPQKQTFAVRLKKLFGLTEKNRDYSLQVWDGDKEKGAVGYLYHETAMEILVNKGWSEEQLTMAKKANEAIQAVVKINNERASNKLIDKAIAHFGPTIEFNTNNRMIIMRYMLREIKDGNNYFPGSHMLYKYVDEVMVRLSTTSDEDRLVAYFLRL